MSAVDYRSIFTRYWTDGALVQADAASDPHSLADRILKICGGGRLLDAGCGTGALARELLSRGVDVIGIDIAAQPIERANQFAPGRFVTGDVLALPFDDQAFETVVCINLLDKLEENDTARAFAELRRVARRNVFIVVRTNDPSEGDYRRTSLDRAGWESRAIAAGLRRHPRSQLVFEYESLENEGPTIGIALERIPEEALARFPQSTLAAERDLHMDMLREPGRRSDAHIARYTLALPFVRAGDTVLDVACGLGYGAAILTQGAQVRRVIGVDNSAYAVEYARLNYAAPGGACEFHVGDAANLTMLPDASVDLVLCMETLEHVPAPEAFLAELNRVLRPSGRLIVSVPNQWVDESGHDPNPHHLSVYDWSKLRDQLSRYFLLETAFAQTAGGALKCREQPRQLRSLPPDKIGDADPEWWIAVAMKSPIGARRESYVETSYPDWSKAADCNIAAFARDYDNPWLVKAMVSIGMRATQPALLDQLANEALGAARPGSADAGAALCVLAYRLLETANADAGKIRSHLDRIAAYHSAADSTPHAWRWRISNEYAAGKLWLNIGDRAAARKAFLTCAGLDPLGFSPLLATKTVDALYWAGLLAAGDANINGARECWQRGLSETQRVLQSGWRNVWGEVDSPASFGLPEVAQLADLATRCSFGLTVLDRWQEQPGLAWVLAQTNQARELAGWRQMAGEMRQWAQQLAEGHDWVAKHADSWRQTAESNGRIIVERDKTIHDLQHWISELESGKRWLEEQRAAFEAESRRQLVTNAELQEWCAKQDQGIAWQKGQIEMLNKRIGELDQELAVRSGVESELREAGRAAQAEAQELREQIRLWKRHLAYRALRKLAVVGELKGD